MNIKFISEKFIYERSIFLREESIRYIKDQIKALHKFFTLINVNDFDYLTKMHIYDLIKFERKKENSNTTINKKISMLKRLIVFSFELGQNSTSELQKILNIEKMKACSLPYSTLSNDELLKVIYFYDNLKMNDFRSFRLKIILGVLLSTGCRANELLNIKINNIDLQNRRIFLEHTKTGIPRFCYLSVEFMQILKDYILKYNHEYLITDFNGCKCTINTLVCIFKRLSKKLMINISPHVIRHTFATRQLQNGIDLESLRLLMGHTRLTTTQIYLSLNDSFVKEQFDKYNILSNV